jgi:hypothetical protein
MDAILGLTPVRYGTVRYILDHNRYGSVRYITSKIRYGSVRYITSKIRYGSVRFSFQIKQVRFGTVQIKNRPVRFGTVHFVLRGVVQHDLECHSTYTEYRMLPYIHLILFGYYFDGGAVLGWKAAPT